jgi:hypothetical protein
VNRPMDAILVDPTLILSDALNAQGSWVDNDSGGYVWDGALTGDSLLDEKSAYLPIADLLDNDVIRVRAYLTATDVSGGVFPTCRLLAGYKNEVIVAPRVAGHAALSSSGAVHYLQAGTLYNVNQYFSNAAYAIKAADYQYMLEIVGKRTADQAIARLYDVSNGYPRMICEAIKDIGFGAPTLEANVGAYSTTGIDKITVHNADVSWSSQSIDYDDAAIWWMPAVSRDTGTYRDARTGTKLCSFVTNSSKIAVVLRNTNIAQHGPRVGWSIDDGVTVKSGHVFYAGSGNDFVIGENLGTGNKTVHIYYDACVGEATQQPRFSSDSGVYVGITGFKIDSTATLGTYTPKPDLICVWGDSRMCRDVTNGVPGTGHAAHAAHAILGRLINAEVAQIGFESQGLVYDHISTAPNGEDSWDFYSAGNSRLSSGLMPVDPKYVIVSWGRNDATFNGGVDEAVFQTAMSNTLTAMRAAMPTAIIIAEVPLERMYSAQITAAVAAQSDANMRVMDHGSAGETLIATETYDGVHLTKTGCDALAVLQAAFINAI